MYAEAEVRKTGTVPSVAAINAVNQVRKRAGLSDIAECDNQYKRRFFKTLIL